MQRKGVNDVAHNILPYNLFPTALNNDGTGYLIDNRSLTDDVSVSLCYQSDNYSRGDDNKY